MLRALRENRIGPHSYAKIQYALLIIHRICAYEEVQEYYGPAYKPIFINTPENNIAMDVAEELLRGEEPISGVVDEPEVKELLTRGIYNYSSEQRQIRSAARIAARDDFDRLLEAIQGSGVVQ